MDKLYAFPWGDNETGGSTGMSLRDYMAAKAMQAIVINTRENLEITYDDVAREAYMQADAMLEARQDD